MKKMRIGALLAALTLLSGCGSNTAPSEESAPSGTETSAADPAATEPADTTEPAAETADVPEIDGYDLLWHDEFDGSSLDESIWNYEPHEPGWTNEELQEYTTSTDNVFLRDGKLVIKAIKSEKDGSDYYTSGKVTAQNKKDFTYGKVVASAKVPAGKGLWPAIWMMPQDEQHYGQWPKCGEIDIMEVLGSRLETAYGTLHYGEPHAEQQGTYVLDNGTFADDFHEFSVEWEPGEMRWYIDGNLYHTVNDWFTAVEGEDDKPYPAPFDQPFFVQMNLAVGGTWPGNPDASTDFDKAEFEVDYVRVYQKPEYDTNVTKPEKNYREALEDGNFIYNGDFSEKEDLTDDVNWKFLLFEGGKGAAEIRDNMMVITTENEGTVDYSVQLVQPEMPMIKGKKYRVTFDAWADEERDIIVCVSAPNAGWIRYLQDTTLTVSKEQKTYTYDFEMKDKDDPLGRLEFNLGHKGSTATVYLTNVRLEEIQ
ncbi:MAG: family 16 glycosylhydrolase [Oscillospiraceae bacterium]|nr:family 16 glycosylhydrolase [Oscillospiraceae bacterium]MCR4761033.1 family 16 glycosylhydrolase [Oscillospiraceae bacterium]